MVDWPRKHGDSYQNQISTNFLYQVIGQTNISVQTRWWSLWNSRWQHMPKLMTQCYHYVFIGFINPENIGIDTKITSMSFLHRNMWKTNFGMNAVAAILKFNKLPNVILTCLIGFLDTVNMGKATKINFLRVSNIEILAKPNSAQTEWRPYWNVFFKWWSKSGKFGEFWYFVQYDHLSFKKKFSLWLFFSG